MFEKFQYVSIICKQGRRGVSAISSFTPTELSDCVSPEINPFEASPPPPPPPIAEAAAAEAAEAAAEAAVLI